MKRILWNYSLKLRLFYFFFIIYNRQNMRRNWLIRLRLTPILYMWLKSYFPLIVFAYKRLNLWYSLWALCNIFSLMQLSLCIKHICHHFFFEFSVAFLVFYPIRRYLCNPPWFMLILYDISNVIHQYYQRQNDYLQNHWCF